MGKLFFVCVIGCLAGKIQAGNPGSEQMRLSEKQRYEEKVTDRLADTMESIGLLRNWNNQQPATEEQKQLAEKIEGDIRQALFLYCLQDSVTEQPPFSEIRALVEQSGIPVRALTKHNLELTAFFQRKDLPGSMEAARHIAKADLSAATMQDWIVLGKTLNFILTEADLSQSKAMLQLLDKLLEGEERPEFFTLKKIRENFEGKIMLIEMGEE